MNTIFQQRKNHNALTKRTRLTARHFSLFPFPFFLKLLLYFSLFPFPFSLHAQGLHFSQYYNTPLLVNPANTALTPDVDYRAGVNYRQQWGAVPVPYRTVSAWADFVTARNTESTSWLGLGGAFFSDKSGNGDLALSRTSLFAAYHLALGYNAMLSAGLSGAYNNRSVDFSKLVFDSQWDGFKFNTALPNREGGYTGQASYWDVGAGLAWAFFPNENLYIQVSGGAQHLNQPTESFYNGANRLGIRPTGHVDVLYKATPGFIINPSAYYTRQKGSQNLVAGAQSFFGVAGTGREAQQLIIGAYYRAGDAAIATAGYQWSGMRLVGSYDVTISGLKKAVPGAGAFELSFIYEGLYSGGRTINKYNCPRF